METSKSFLNTAELNNSASWLYYNEGNNNIILRYVGSDAFLSTQILRIRKNTNVEYYLDPTLYPIDEYNKLFIDKVFLQHPVMHKYLQEFQYVNLDLEFLKEIDTRLLKKEQKVSVKSTIDLINPSAMLATNFSSSHEPGDDNQKLKILAFEAKPKSCVIEYVPSSVQG